MYYIAVNTSTKEHRRINNMREKPAGIEWKVAQAMPDGFIQYSPNPTSDWRYAKLPNEQPVVDDEDVVVLLRSGELDEGAAWEYDWCCVGDSSDIIAYLPTHIRDCSVDTQYEPVGVSEALEELNESVGAIYHSTRIPTKEATRHLIKAASDYLLELENE